MTNLIIGGIFIVLIIIGGLVALRFVSAGARRKDIEKERAARSRQGKALMDISNALYQYQGQLDEVGEGLAITVRQHLLSCQEDLLKLENK